VFPLLSYRPTNVKLTKKLSAQERSKLEDELSQIGLDEQNTAALQTIIHSDKIDYEVFPLRWLSWIWLILS
jgi:ABC-type uncharacterized transport system ATPase subunit